MKNVEDIYPLTPAQEGMLFHCLAAPRSGVYHEQVSFTLTGRLDESLLAQAWRQIVRRHAALRTVFLWEGLDHPVQVVHEAVELPWERQDWRDLNSQQRQERWTGLLESDRARGFDLARAPLMRFTLLVTGDDTSHLLWSFHHLLSDGWSTALVLKQVMAEYDALCRGESRETAPTLPFRNFIAWLAAQDETEAQAYWRGALGDFKTPTLATTGDAAPDPTCAIGREELELPPPLVEQLVAAARRQRVTLNTLVQGAWAILLGYYTGEDDVVFGSTVAGRSAQVEGVESMVGNFINTLPVRARLSPDAKLCEWLKALQRDLVAARRFEHASLARVQKLSGVEAGRPLFDSIVVFENYPLGDAMTEAPGGLRVSDLHYHEKSHYPLALLVVPPRPGSAGHATNGQNTPMRLILIHQRDRIDRPRVERMLRHFRTLLDSMAANDDAALRQLSILTPDETPRSPSPEETATDSIADGCCHQWIERIAARTPDAPAVACGDARLTYGQLNQRANQLAHYLRAQGIAANDRVGICLDRSVAMIVAILGVLKAGGAYVPMDPSYPRERLSFMLRDAGVQRLITRSDLLGALPETDATAFCMDRDGAAIETFDHHDPTQVPAPQDLAYVIYTSGSTGRPRGVMVSHGNLAYSTAARLRFYDQPVRRFLLVSTFAFDSSIAGIFGTLCQGGFLRVPEEAHHQDLSHLAHLIDKDRITHVLCIPAVYQQLLNDESPRLASLKLVMVAGEVCPAALVTEHRRRLPGTALFNEYGPTEGTVWCTAFDCTAYSGNGSVPIGRPVPGTRIGLLDRWNRPVPIGVRGEIHISGPGVALGYLNQPQLTAERFIVDPLDPSGRTRCYRTGDWARLGEDGDLEFLGRFDDQVKLRGYRIEPGEIERTLLRDAAVADAAVVVAPPVEAATDRSRRNGQPPDAAELARCLASLPPREALAILQDIESIDGEHGEAFRRPAATVSRQEADSAPLITSAANVLTHHGEGFELVLRLLKDRLIDPPRATQRQWLLDQLLAEWADDVAHLRDAAARFVPGGQQRLGEFDIAQAALEPQQIMEDWQEPVMRAMAGQLGEPAGDVLEVGFGRGVCATFIQQQGARSHTVVECNDHCVRAHFEPWRRRYADRPIHLLKGRWQDLAGELGAYDGILFHAFPLNEREFIEHVVNDVTFAAHFFQTAADHLRPGGVFTYLTTEIDSLSRRHQRRLLKHFRSVSMQVEPVKVPPDTRDTWWADSMVVIKAVKA